MSVAADVVGEGRGARSEVRTAMSAAADVVGSDDEQEVRRHRTMRFRLTIFLHS